MASKDKISQFPLSNQHAQRSKQADLNTVGQSLLGKGEVALVGAGPGDVELLTLKALRFLQQADVVLYDYLVSDDIISLVPSDTILVCVGKRAGHHSVPQEKTNQLLLDFALQGHRVVRIKGGDPFIFGRGGEELEVLADAGVSFHVVPGITAAAGATAYAGIPLTHRDYAQSAMFITGHLKAESDQMDWSTLARGNQTLVIYMGLMKSEYIQSQLIEHGRQPETPIAIIERGTHSKQKVFKGQLNELADLAKDAQSPSLIVVGEVVALSEKLAWFEPQAEQVTAQRQSA
ncbi:uroporphyrinogen-III C-methyltransferase [Vibrio europaeus]|jgi:uroporphyrin-III C-methyltransferase|uniref:uroporphyrinogen-III C-methyltransferase n=2 Tax=Vibrio oreintalis group TaxID=1891919 RepID=F9TCB6_9VIBR|nr:MULTISPECIES: uroporphyrinogen-III C-methyltransferase [Vibrio oreintalis group]AIW12878.1 uroporphyrin-III methyltransferase [Vibrio tubiashii ATCC 19109]EGU47974.1 uroporphyrin-III C-methyltransferase [Vibrio tubiashii ATCC 19109]EIF03404.1 uroporphyrin-III C-methyltransferase [Vibrio tubiashii NCIMB 1337 = ATCC 19106]MDC5702984.1 uroporphyrinogen-III C-methyltransferase [Vibrio europaeus]MDC5708784.1 uroporphyrinogen-III C-methyltransferase [Vibrio europaeus]